MKLDAGESVRFESCDQLIGERKRIITRIRDEDLKVFGDDCRCIHHVPPDAKASAIYITMRQRRARLALAPIFRDNLH
jgi:hypothetical protein